MKFQARDFIMVPSKQLQACSTESVKMLKRVGPNAYIVDFQTDYKMTPSLIVRIWIFIKAQQFITNPMISSKSLYQHVNKILMLF